MEEPEQIGQNGRRPNGTFAPGNPGGPGPLGAKRVAEYREAIFKAVSADDLEAIVRKLARRALKGDVHAAREVLDRILGKPKQSIDIAGALEILKLYAKDAPTEAV